MPHFTFYSVQGYKFRRFILNTRTHFHEVFLLQKINTLFLTLDKVEIKKYIEDEILNTIMKHIFQKRGIDRHL